MGSDPTTYFTEWRRLHPASLVVNLIPRTWRFLGASWPFLLLIYAGSGQLGTQAFDLIYLLLLLAWGSTETLIHYATLRYRIREGRLEIRQGLLNRQVRIIDPSRIQNAELLRNPFHKLSGMVEVRLETAGDIRTEGLLSALAVEDAEALMAALDDIRGRTPVEPGSEEEDDTPLLSLGGLDLIAHGMSAGRTGLGALLFFGGLQAMGIVDPGQARALSTPTQLVGLALLAWAASWVLSTLLSLVRHHRYRLFHEGDRLRSEQGLVTRRRVEIPLHKVQLVRVEESLLRRWMGYGGFSVETAGLGPVEDGPPAAELKIPFLPKESMEAMCTRALPKVEPIEAWSTELRRPHPNALTRGLLSAVMRWSVVLPAAWMYGGPPLVAACAAMTVLALLGVWLDFLYQGWEVTPSGIVSRRGFWQRTTWLLAREKIQSVHLHQGPVLRLFGLGRVAVRVAGAQVVLPDIGVRQATYLMEQLTPASRPFPRPHVAVLPPAPELL